MQGFAGGEQSTESDGINKENIAAGDSAKLTEWDTGGEGIVQGIESSDQSRSTSSWSSSTRSSFRAEPQCSCFLPQSRLYSSDGYSSPQCECLEATCSPSCSAGRTRRHTVEDKCGPFPHGLHGVNGSHRSTAPPRSIRQISHPGWSRSVASMQPCPFMRRHSDAFAGVLQRIGAWHRHRWRRTDPTASTSSTSLYSSSIGRHLERNVKDRPDRTIELALVISGVYGQEKGRQLQILRWLPPDEFRDHRGHLPCAGRERCLIQSSRRQVLRHDRLVVWILAAWHDTTCTRKVCILHHTWALSVHQDALWLIQCTSFILSAYADHPLRSSVRLLHLLSRWHHSLRWDIRAANG